MVEVCAATLFTTGAATVWTTAAVSTDAVPTAESVLEAAFSTNAVSAAEADKDVVSTGTIEVSAVVAEKIEEVRVSIAALSAAAAEVVVSSGTTGVAEGEEVTTALSATEADEGVISTETAGTEEAVVSTETTATGVEDTTAMAVDDEATVGSTEA